MRITSEQQFDLMRWIFATFLMMLMALVMMVVLFIIMVIEGG